MANICIVVANEPRVYREAFAAVLQELRPYIEVICIEPDDLDEKVSHGRPRLVLCSQLTEAVQTCYAVLPES